MQLDLITERGDAVWIAGSGLGQERGWRRVSEYQNCYKNINRPIITVTGVNIGCWTRVGLSATLQRHFFLD